MDERFFAQEPPEQKCGECGAVESVCLCELVNHIVFGSTWERRVVAIRKFCFCGCHLTAARSCSQCVPCFNPPPMTIGVN